jgi:Na+-driven multidrug efflux pump
MFWTVTCGAAPSILNVVMAYMVRSEGAAFHASVGTMSGCFLNVILDPIFILPFGFNMGAAGAGLATFLSNCAACLYFFVLIFARRKTTNVCVSPKKLTLKKDVVFGVFTVGIPAAIQNLLNVTGATLLNNMTASYGANAIAAMGISQKINMIPMYIASGLSQGIMPFISYNYASKNIKRMRGALTFAAKISLTFLIVVASTFFFASEFYISLFMKNEQIIAYGSRFLRGFSLALPLLSIDFLAVGVFQAVGMGKEALSFALLRKLALEIPALYILNKLFPLYGLPYAQPIAELVLAIAAVVMLIRLFKKIETATPEPEYD